MFLKFDLLLETDKIPLCTDTGGHFDQRVFNTILTERSEVGPDRYENFGVRLGTDTDMKVAGMADIMKLTLLVT